MAYVIVKTKVGSDQDYMRRKDGHRVYRPGKYFVGFYPSPNTGDIISRWSAEMGPNVRQFGSKKLAIEYMHRPNSCPLPEVEIKLLNDDGTFGEPMPVIIDKSMARVTEVSKKLPAKTQVRQFESRAIGKIRAKRNELQEIYEALTDSSPYSHELAGELKAYNHVLSVFDQVRG